MNKNIYKQLFRLQSDGSWGDAAATLSLLQAGTKTSDAIDISQCEGIVQIQVSHASDGAATITGEILESVDGVEFVENATGFGDTIAKATPTIYSHDAKANRFIKIKVTEDNVAATVVTLSLTVK
jgi:hypothetical protein